MGKIISGVKISISKTIFTCSLIKSRIAFSPMSLASRNFLELKSSIFSVRSYEKWN